MSCHSLLRTFWWYPTPSGRLARTAWSCPDPSPISFRIPILHHAGCVFLALAQSALVQIFQLFLVISISSQILPSWLFNSLPSQYHVTPFSFYPACLSLIFFFFLSACFLSFCPKSPRLTWAENSSVLFSTISLMLAHSSHLVKICWVSE